MEAYEVVLNATEILAVLQVTTRRPVLIINNSFKQKKLSGGGSGKMLNTGEWSSYAIILIFPHFVSQVEWKKRNSMKENCLSRLKVKPGPLDCRSSIQAATPQRQLS